MNPVYNSFVEDILIQDNGDIHYICKYPAFMNNKNNDPRQPCSLFKGCSPSGILIDSNSNSPISNPYKSINKALSSYRCSCKRHGISHLTAEGYPECRQLQVEDIVQNPSNPDLTRCLGAFEWDGTKCLCPTGYIRTSNVSELEKVGYKSTIAYDLSQLPEFCVRRPCEFDAHTGRFLNNNMNRSPYYNKLAFYDQNQKTCKCDVTYGYMGIFIDEAGNGNAVETQKGYNACLSINQPVSDHFQLNAAHLSFYDEPDGLPQLWFSPVNPSEDVLGQPIPSSVTIRPLYTSECHNAYIPPIDLDEGLAQGYNFTRGIPSYRHPYQPDASYPPMLMTTYKNITKQPSIFKDGDVIKNPASMDNKYPHNPPLVDVVYPHMLISGSENFATSITTDTQHSIPTDASINVPPHHVREA